MKLEDGSYAPAEFAQEFVANRTDLTYHALLHRVLTEGERRPDRTGVGTIGVFGHFMEFDLRTHFPLGTTKRLSFKSIAEELLWFLRGEQNIRSLQERGVSIWDEWADADGNLGPVYGVQWRGWMTAGGQRVDQIANVINDLRHNPHSRRHIVSAWNVGEIQKMALPPCHLLVQFYVDAQKKLSGQMYQRSADIFLGVPFNIASYALLTRMVAQVVGLEPGWLKMILGDAHLYLNHLEQAREQLSRTPFPSPRLELDPGVTEIDDFRFEHIKLVGYQSHPSIKAQ